MRTCDICGVRVNSGSRDVCEFDFANAIALKGLDYTTGVDAAYADQEMKKDFCPVCEDKYREVLTQRITEAIRFEAIKKEVLQ